MVKDIDWEKKLKNKKCQLCGRPHLCDERVSFYVGGFVTYAHPCCLKIYARGCELREKWEKLMGSIKNKSEGGETSASPTSNEGI